MVSLLPWTSEVHRRTKLKRAEREDRISSLPEYHEPLTGREQDLLDKPVQEACELVRKGELEPSELLTAYGKKAIDAHNDTNCLTEVAIRDAEIWSKQCNRSGPLAGFPLSLKDNFGLGGYDASMGYAAQTCSPKSGDSSLVRLLKDAGAVPFVKTNVPVGMLSIESYNDVWGYTVNPHNSNYCPGGSSSGEGALIAKGGSRIGIGTDIGGSVRIPAHFCGIYSLRMTHNRFPRANDDTPLPGFEGIPDVASPMARTLADLRYFVDSVMSMRPWTYCYQLLPLAWSPERAKLPSRPKVGLLRNDGLLDVTPAVSRALDMAAQALQDDANCEIVDFVLPHSGTVYDSVAASLFGADGFGLYSRPFLRGENIDPVAGEVIDYMKIPRFIRRFYEFLLRWVFGMSVQAEIRANYGPVSVTDYYDAVAKREKLREEFWQAWKQSGIDFLILPVYPSPALPKKFDPPDSACQYTTMFNVLDYPAGVVPVSQVKASDALPKDFDLKSLNLLSKSYFSVYNPTKMQGLPLGVQVVCRRFEDEKVLAAMELLDSALHKSQG